MANSNGTKLLERDIERATEYGRQTLEKVAEQFAPVPLDSQAVTLEDQRFDFENRGPDYLQKLLGSATFQVTSLGHPLIESLNVMMQHIDKMQEK